MLFRSDRYAPFRDDWALSLSARGREAIADYLASGRGLLAIHAAPISFDDWPAWAGLLGVGWRWGVSHHPPFGPAEIRPARAHPITDGMEPFETADEIYSGLDVADWMVPLAEGRTPETAWTPVVYAGERDGARRAWCGIGHCAASFAHPGYAAMIARAARWVARDL